MPNTVSGCGCASAQTIEKDTTAVYDSKPSLPESTESAPYTATDSFEAETIAGIEFVKLQGGHVSLGAEDTSLQNPVHCAMIKPLLVGRYEVTHAQMNVYIKAMGKNTHARLYKDQYGKIHIGERGPEDELRFNGYFRRSKSLYDAMDYLGAFRVVPFSPENSYDPRIKFADPNRPVDNISWYEALGFMDYMSDITQRQFRFLTADEWEYAAKGGEDHKYPTATGELKDYHGNWQGNYLLLESTPVGQYAPNPYGLYDMSGNVAEWTMTQAGPESMVALGGARSYWLNSTVPELREISERASLTAYRLRTFRSDDFRYNSVGLRVAVETEENCGQDTPLPQLGSP